MFSKKLFPTRTSNATIKSKTAADLSIMSIYGLVELKPNEVSTPILMDAVIKITTSILPDRPQKINILKNLIEIQDPSTSIERREELIEENTKIIEDTTSSGFIPRTNAETMNERQENDVIYLSKRKTLMDSAHEKLTLLDKTTLENRLRTLNDNPLDYDKIKRELAIILDEVEKLDNSNNLRLKNGVRGGISRKSRIRSKDVKTRRKKKTKRKTYRKQ